ncbi:hypothetical protein [Sporomusa sp.]|uniref:hypothetical protein n=1 Tax=Sporomusa sp. TaxID=2078658 RepID=UPI002D1AA05E|nr:hypothetical protein [Sporomusa sp.]HWR42977.1 hypothetical protein [Sporomusa sp.]
MKEVLSRIPTLYTFETPIRPVAFTNHCVWVEQVNKCLQEGFECAIYYEPYTNFENPYTLDAIYIEILAKQKRYCISGFGVIPDRERHEIKISEQYTEYAKAKQVAINWLLATREIIMLH